MNVKIEIQVNQPRQFAGAFGRVIRMIFQQIVDGSLRDGTGLGFLKEANKKKFGFYQVILEGTGIPGSISQPPNSRRRAKHENRSL
jgi:hypothetical protein